MDPLSDVKDALQKLETLTKSRRKVEIKEPAEKLPLVLALLEHSSPSRTMFEQVCELLEGPLVKLYEDYADPTLHFASVLLTRIHQKKVLGQPEMQQERWESVSHAVLSGVWDYLVLESRSPESTKNAITKHLFPTLCRDYLPETPSHKTGRRLFAMVFNILDETATGSLTIQRKLRDPELLGGVGSDSGKHCPGLENTQDFHVLESLIELLTTLLPLTQATDQEYTVFLNNVFKPIFANHHELRSLIDSANVIKREQLVLDIVRLLARVDPTFPQGFAIQNSPISYGSQLPVGHLYLDDEALLSAGTVDEKEVAHYKPYSEITRIRHSKISQDPCIIAISFDIPIRATVSFAISNHDQERFVETIKVRGWEHILEEFVEPIHTVPMPAVQRVFGKRQQHGILDPSDTSYSPPCSDPHHRDGSGKELSDPEQTLVANSFTPVIVQDSPSEAFQQIRDEALGPAWLYTTPAGSIEPTTPQPLVESTPRSSRESNTERNPAERLFDSPSPTPYPATLNRPSRHSSPAGFPEIDYVDEDTTKVADGFVETGMSPTNIIRPEQVTVLRQRLQQFL